MRRITTTLKLSSLLLILSLGFLFIWDPLTKPHIEKLLLKAAIASNKSTTRSYLTKIDRVDHSNEITFFSHEASQTAGTQVVSSDERIIAMRQFLMDHHSPLYPYAEVFVTEADRVNLDWRLVASISGVESAFGNLIPYRSNNAWGWKGDPTRDWSYFTSWKVGISTVTERIALGYGTDTTPFKMESTYCPPCGLNPAHAWANGVTNYMNNLEAYRKAIK